MPPHRAGGDISARLVAAGTPRASAAPAPLYPAAGAARLPSVCLAEHPVTFLMLIGGFRTALSVALCNDSGMGGSDQARTRICDGCGRPMSYLGKLPQAGRKPAVFVYRCFGCNRVTSEPVI
jgi:hypothetical protein